VNHPVKALLFSEDPVLARAVTAYAGESLKVEVHPHERLPETLLDKQAGALVFVDLAAPRALPLIEQIKAMNPEHVVIALGSPGSHPVREARALGVFAADSRELDRLHFQTLVAHGLDRLGLQHEIRVLKESTGTPPPAATPAPQGDRMSGGMPLHYFSRALHHFDDPAALLDSVIEGIAGTAKVTRAGLFSQIHAGGPYRLSANLRCLEQSGHLRFEEAHPLVRWMETYAHMVARSTLEYIPDPSDRLLLKQVLDNLGAEILLPLFARGRLSGWIFLGQRATGLPFSLEELEDLAVLTEHIATTLENARLYEEVALQKTLVETLFHSVPIGVVAVSPDGMVRWINKEAERLLDCPGESVLNRPAAQLGSRLADYLHRAQQDELLVEGKEWVHPETKYVLLIQTNRLADGNGKCLGAVALIHDLTAVKKLKAKQEHVERSAFWNELAASMSHEIRNPLVAIKTFAQLLPERYDDPAFRAEFSTLVAAEVGRLDRIIEQINGFANPPAMIFQELRVDTLAEEAIKKARAMHAANGVLLDVAVDPGLPPVTGDEHALCDGLTHLITNALEAVSGHEQGQVEVRVERVPSDVPDAERNGYGPDAVRISVYDNGPGIPPEIRDRVFSPFCTTKVCGMGLGLPIAQRVALDHNGRIEIQNGLQGTRVMMQLPTTPARKPPG
jgi:nitrogen-specific signal transduction histidine kinase